jgi:hypothetical protein
MVFVVPSVLTIAPISYVDLTIFLFSCGPLALGFQESGPGFRGLYAYISDYEKIRHSFVLFHGDLLHSLDVTDPIVKGIDDLDVLHVRDSVSGIVEMFHVIPQSFIMLLPGDL